MFSHQSNKRLIEATHFNGLGNCFAIARRTASPGWGRRANPRLITPVGYLGNALLVLISMQAILFGAQTANAATTENKASSSQKERSVVVDKNPSLTPDEAVNVRVYKSANRGVVNISSLGADQDMFFNLVPRQGCGSGTIISESGYILTNYHVIENASQVEVTLFDGSTLVAQVVGQDPSNDLAVLKIKAPPTKKLTVVPFGDSSKLQVGRRVFAIGNPFGFDRTMTTGIVSSLGRTLRTENERLIKGIIQTDAAINPGNSGGPLLDTAGNIVGITTAIFSRAGQSAGIGMAIPINIAKRIVPELITNHYVVRADIGIQKLDQLDSGLRVVKLDPQGPAAKAGIVGPKIVIFRNGLVSYQWLDWSCADIITKLDNAPMRVEDDLFSYLELKHPGQVVTLTILRGGHTLKIQVKLNSGNSA